MSGLGSTTEAHYRIYMPLIDRHASLLGESKLETNKNSPMVVHWGAASHSSGIAPSFRISILQGVTSNLTQSFARLLDSSFRDIVASRNAVLLLWLPMLRRAHSYHGDAIADDRDTEIAHFMKAVLSICNPQWKNHFLLSDVAVLSSN